MNKRSRRQRLCFFAEDTDIFRDADLFTETVEQMSEKDSFNAHDVIDTIFRAMDTKIEDRAAANPCTLLNLRKRMAKIRMFGYKEMLAIRSGEWQDDGVSPP